MKEKIKIESKRLNSGKYQIKFFVQNELKKERYGYILAEPTTTLKEVVLRINEKILGENDFSYVGLMKSNQNREIVLF